MQFALEYSQDLRLHGITPKPQHKTGERRRRRMTVEAARRIGKGRDKAFFSYRPGCAAASRDMTSHDAAYVWFIAYGLCLNRLPFVHRILGILLGQGL